MYYMPAMLELRSYKPLEINKDMWFRVITKENTKWEEEEIVPLYKLINSALIPQNKINEVLMLYGYPVEPYVVDYEGNVMATPDQIGWWDEGEDSDELYDITLKEINMIINEFDGELSISVDEDEEDGELYTIIYLDKVTLSFPVEEDYEDDEDELECNEEVWLNGKVISTSLGDEPDTFSHLVEYLDDYYIILTDMENQLLYPYDDAQLAPEI